MYQNPPAPQITPLAGESPTSAPQSNVAAQAESNPNPYTGNVAESTPTVLIYLEDGTLFAATDYWVTGYTLHYRVSYGGEGAVDIDQVDWQRTVKENAKRGVPFKLKTQPVQPTPPAAQLDKAVRSAVPA
jgi:hypothetical protein